MFSRIIEEGGNMAKTGYFEVNIGNIHLDWGIERNGRSQENGEGYIKIPSKDAQRLEIYNHNFLGRDEYGVNLFYAEFPDGFKKGEKITLKASGNSGKDSPNYKYAKNLHGEKNLKLINEWFKYRNANTSNRVRVTVISPDTIKLEIIQK